MTKPEAVATAPATITNKARWWVIIAALIALFLGAMDALVMSAAMPTVIAELGGLDIYSWVYTAYFLARAVALPVFGKLADLYKVRTLFLISIGGFLISSLVAGFSPNMFVLIVARVFQGIAAGGNFALVYIVLSDMSPPGKRAKTLSLASFIWGIASVLGPTIGGFIVTYFSWPWVFFINIPVCLVSMGLLSVYLVEIRAKKETIHLDVAGVVTLTVAMIGLLALLMLGGEEINWLSPMAMGLFGMTLIAGVGFYFAEKSACEPIIALSFFRIRGFAIGNLAVFLSSFVIFALFAYAPLFIQGALGRTPVQVGLAMLSLSFGWSLGSLSIGQVFYRIKRKRVAVAGAVLLIAGSSMTLFFNHETSMAITFWVFLFIGIGMGFVAISTLLVVQGALDESDLGVATSSNQFARSLGGTVGVGVCGAMVTGKIQAAVEDLIDSGSLARLSPQIVDRIRTNHEQLFEPAFQSMLQPEARQALRLAMGENMQIVFWIVFFVSVLCLVVTFLLPGNDDSKVR